MNTRDFPGWFAASAVLGAFLASSVFAQEDLRGPIRRLLEGPIAPAGDITVISGPAPSSLEKSTYESGDYERRIAVDERQRKYLIHVPALYRKNKAAAVVLNFHGGASNAYQQRQRSRMDRTSDDKGFIVVYPDGMGYRNGKHSYNVGPGYGFPWKNKIDDVHFVEILLDDLAKLFHVDPERIYSTGFSNGAMMCYRLAADLPERIAAIAPVSGSLPLDYLSFEKPISIIHFHGLEDRQYPFAGGMGQRVFSNQPLFEFASVKGTLDWYIKKNNCPVKTAKTSRKGKAVCRVFGPGNGGAEVVLWTLEDGGHTWPNGDHRIKQLGNVNLDVKPNELMWEFFKQHPLPRTSRND